MSAVVKQLLDVLLSQGPLGVVVAGMALWIWKLQGQLVAAQEQRVQDAYRFVDTAKACAVALERNNDTLKSLMEG